MSDKASSAFSMLDTSVPVPDHSQALRDRPSGRPQPSEVRQVVEHNMPPTDTDSALEPEPSHEDSFKAETPDEARIKVEPIEEVEQPSNAQGARGSQNAWTEVEGQPRPARQQPNQARQQAEPASRQSGQANGQPNIDLNGGHGVILGVHTRSASQPGQKINCRDCGQRHKPNKCRLCRNCGNLHSGECHRRVREPHQRGAFPGLPGAATQQWPRRQLGQLQQPSQQPQTVSEETLQNYDQRQREQRDAERAPRGFTYGYTPFIPGEGDEAARREFARELLRYTTGNLAPQATTSVNLRTPATQQQQSGQQQSKKRAASPSQEQNKRQRREHTAGNLQDRPQGSQVYPTVNIPLPPGFGGRGAGARRAGTMRTASGNPGDDPNSGTSSTATQGGKKKKNKNKKNNSAQQNGNSSNVQQNGAGRNGQQSNGGDATALHQADRHNQENQDPSGGRASHRRSDSGMGED